MDNSVWVCICVNEYGTKWERWRNGDLGAWKNKKPLEMGLLDGLFYFSICLFFDDGTARVGLNQQQAFFFLFLFLFFSVIFKYP